MDEFGVGGQVQEFDRLRQRQQRRRRKQHRIRERDNRADRARIARTLVGIVIGRGLLLSGQMFFIMEYTWDVMLHRAIAYICLAITVPVVLAIVSQASRFRWASCSRTGPVVPQS